MANHLKVNPATSGENKSRMINRVAIVLHDKEGSDIKTTNPLKVKVMNIGDLSGE